jgi:hypothetical protein
MMQELRDIRADIARETHGMSQEDRAAWFAERAKAAMASLGYELHRHPDRPRALKVVKKQETAE